MSDAKSVIVITGASGALGSALVQRFADRGRVIALERSKDGQTGLERVSDTQLRLRTDTGNPDALRAALERAEAELGPLTGAVLTAGAWRGGHAFHEADAATDYRTVMDANLESAQVALRAMLGGMVARRRGSIVLIGSRSGARPFSAPGDAAYAATKAALMALTQTIAAEVLEHGVRLNMVMPSTIDTTANRQAMPGADTSRWVTVDSLGDVIDFLLSERSRDVSGAAIPVYGKGGV